MRKCDQISTINLGECNIGKNAKFKNHSRYIADPLHIHCYLSPVSKLLSSLFSTTLLSHYGHFLECVLIHYQIKQ